MMQVSSDEKSLTGAAQSQDGQVPTFPMSPLALQLSSRIINSLSAVSSELPGHLAGPVGSSAGISGAEVPVPATHGSDAAPPREKTTVFSPPG